MRGAGPVVQGGREGFPALPNSFPMPRRSETFQILSVALAALVCCILPFLLIGGVSLVGGLRWGKPVLLLVGAIVLALVIGRVVRAASRERRWY